MDQKAMVLLRRNDDISYRRYILLIAGLLGRLAFIHVGHGCAMDDDLRAVPLKDFQHVLFIGNVHGSISKPFPCLGQPASAPACGDHMEGIFLKESIDQLLAKQAIRARDQQGWFIFLRGIQSRILL